jgi:predicted transcriptional regulator
VTEHERALLLSVRPRFAESITTGAKSAEVRRRRLGVDPGTPVIIYATMPIAAVVGTARVAAISPGRPSDLWSRYHQQMDMSREEFDNYLKGVSIGYVLTIIDPQRLKMPLALSYLRASADFQPPRSFQYLTRRKLYELVNGHPGGGPLLDLIPADQMLEAGANRRADPREVPGAPQAGQG